MLAIALTTNPRSQTTANHLGDDIAKAGASWRERSGGRAQTGRTEAVNTFGCTFDGHTVARCRRSVPAQLQEKTVQVCAFAWEACPVINSPAFARMFWFNVFTFSDYESDDDATLSYCSQTDVLSL